MFEFLSNWFHSEIAEALAKKFEELEGRIEALEARFENKPTPELPPSGDTSPAGGV